MRVRAGAMRVCIRDMQEDGEGAQQGGETGAGAGAQGGGVPVLVYDLRNLKAFTGSRTKPPLRLSFFRFI